MNIAELFVQFTKSNPHKAAFIIPHEGEDKKVTYKQFFDLVSRYREGLSKSGHKKGDRIILLMPINLDFYAVMMAMISLGIVAVFLDPGIGIKKLLVAITDSKAKTIISIDKFFKYRLLIPSLWRKKLYSVDSQGLGLKSFKILKSDKSSDFNVTQLKPNDHFLITFTSGSTGRSKGSDRNVENVFNQVNAIKDLWPSDSKQVDFSSFLMFGFMNLCFGITTVIPPMNYSNVKDIDVEEAVRMIKKYRVTRLSGSSAFLSKITEYLVSKGEAIEHIICTAQGGSPVNDEFCRNMENSFPNAKNLIVYGSTEVAPISTALISEVRKNQLQGSLVGKPAPGLTVKVVSLPSGSILFDEKEATPFEKKINEWGEVIVKGPHVVKGYVDNPKAVLENKILTPAGEVWHRTGDIGHFDEAGNLWITGRASELIEIAGKTYRPYIVEAKINEVNNVKRSALISTKKGPVLVIENTDEVLLDEIQKNLKELSIKQVKITFIKEMPVDVRHNSKINRIELAKIIK